jgi:protein Mpv17
MLAAYELALTRRPLLTRVVQSGLIVGTGDILAQKFVEANPSFDFPRFRGATLTGAFFVGPALYGWYTKTIPRIMARINIKSPIGSTLVATAIDQTLFACFLMAGFFPCLEFFKSFDFDAGIDSLKRNFWAALITNWKVWPPIILVNYYYVPIKFQPLYINFIALFWNCYLSYQNTMTENQVRRATESVKDL